MEFDEFLVSRVQQDSGNPVLRLYGWNPPAISIGYHEPENDFNLTLLRNDGVEIVRRPTGGRAILHNNELTYSVILCSDGRGVRSVYRSINLGILRGLTLLGIAATLTDAGDDLRSVYRDPALIPCFAASAKSEIQFEGKKLVGSAQRRFQRVILQQGSILLGPQHRNIVRYLSAGSELQTHILEEVLDAKTADAESILGRSIPFEQAADAIKKGFELEHGIVFVEDHSLYVPA